MLEDKIKEKVLAIEKKEQELHIAKVALANDIQNMKNIISKTKHIELEKHEKEEDGISRTS